MLPLLVLLLLLSIAVWVYIDAKTQTARGTPVVFSYGRIEISTPDGWLLCCLFLGLVFFPLYMAGRSR